MGERRLAAGWVVGAGSGSECGDVGGDRGGVEVSCLGVDAMAKLKTNYLVVQQGGSSTEFYIHALSTLRQVERYRKSCDRAAYATSEPIEVPAALVEQDGFLDAVQDVMSAMAGIE